MTRSEPPPPITIRESNTQGDIDTFLTLLAQIVARIAREESLPAAEPVVETPDMPQAA